MNFSVGTCGCFFYILLACVFFTYCLAGFAQSLFIKVGCQALLKVSIICFIAWAQKSIIIFRTMNFGFSNYLPPPAHLPPLHNKWGNKGLNSQFFLMSNVEISKLIFIGIRFFSYNLILLRLLLEAGQHKICT